MDDQVVSLAEVAAMDDEQLADLMMQHHQPNQACILRLDRLPPAGDEREQFRQRLLRAHQIAGARHASTTLDVDQLDARLRLIRDNKPAGHQTPSRVTESQSSEYEQPPIKTETRAYHQLLRDGAQPAYPIEQLESYLAYYENKDGFTSEDNQHRTLRWPWQDLRGRRGINPTWWCAEHEIFSRQLNKWTNFRTSWQKGHRNMHAETWQSWLDRMQRLDRELPGAPHWEIDEEWWEHIQIADARWRKWCREPDCGNFADYDTALRRRLLSHGFDRPFQLHEDPAQQDRLTTWIEYLGFECWFLDRFIAKVERWQPGHEQRWRDLVETGVLRHGETLDSIHSNNEQLKCCQDADDASNNLFQARAENREPAVIQAAQERYDTLQGRWNILREFVSKDEVFKRTRDVNIPVQRSLIQWILEQIPVIEASTEQAARKPSRRRKRRRAAEEDESDAARTKKTKGYQSPTLGSFWTTSSTRSARTASSRVCRKLEHTDARPARRSARIAARAAATSR